MEVNPASNITHVHQNTLVASTKQGDFQNRLDVQSNAIAESIKEKEKEVEDVRPTEETHKIDPEKEHEREKKEQEQQNAAKENKKEEEEDLEKPSTSEDHILDIKV